MKATERGIKALEYYLQRLRNLGQHEIIMTLPTKLGMGKDDFERVRNGERLLSMKELHALLDVFYPAWYIKESKLAWVDCFLEPPTFELVGLLEPQFTLKKLRSGEKISEIQAFLDFPHVIIDSDVRIEEKDILSHSRPDGIEEGLVVMKMDYSPYAKPHKPLYNLTVARLSPDVEMDNGGNVTKIIINQAPYSRANVHSSDNSINTYKETPELLFEEVRKLVETLNVDSRQEILEAIDEMKKATEENNKQEAEKWYSKFLGFTAKFIKTYPALIQIIGDIAKVLPAL